MPHKSKGRPCPRSSIKAERPGCLRSIHPSNIPIHPSSAPDSQPKKQSRIGSIQGRHHHHHRLRRREEDGGCQQWHARAAPGAPPRPGGRPRRVRRARRLQPDAAGPADRRARAAPRGLLQRAERGERRRRVRADGGLPVGAGRPRAPQHHRQRQLVPEDLRAGGAAARNEDLVSYGVRTHSKSLPSMNTPRCVQQRAVKLRRSIT